MTIANRARAMEAAESIAKNGCVVLGGTTYTEYQKVGEFFGVKKAEISKLKNMSAAEKEKLREKAASADASTRTRIQVCSLFVSCFLFHTILLCFCLLATRLLFLI